MLHQPLLIESKILFCEVEDKPACGLVDGMADPEHDRQQATTDNGAEEPHPSQTSVAEERKTGSTRIRVGVEVERKDGIAALAAA